MPCKPMMRGCRANCLHRHLVDRYHEARRVWENDREEASIGYRTEAELWEKDHPGPTFKQWLIDSKNTKRGQRS